MFLSRMALDLTQRETYPFLHSKKYAKDQIASLFSTGLHNVLWRIDEMDGRLWLVILSQLRPDYETLHSKIGFQGVFPSWDIIDYSEVTENLSLSNIYHFQTCVCPMEPVQQQTSFSQNVVQVYDWFNHQSMIAGFHVLQYHTILSHWHIMEEGYVLFSKVDGLLQITSIDTFEHTLLYGLGNFKAYGAGLLTISQNRNIWT